MKQSMTESIFGLVTACEWDRLGNPIRVKICTQNELDYYVVENDLGKQLLHHLKTWVRVSGKVLPFEMRQLIDIQEIHK